MADNTSQEILKAIKKQQGGSRLNNLLLTALLTVCGFFAVDSYQKLDRLSTGYISLEARFITEMSTIKGVLGDRLTVDRGTALENQVKRLEKKSSDIDKKVDTLSQLVTGIKARIKHEIRSNDEAHRRLGHSPKKKISVISDRPTKW